MGKIDLCLHCGANAVDLEDVKGVNTPSPDGNWHPIPHSYLANTVVSELQALNMEVVGAAHALSRSGQRYFGLFEVAGNSDDHGLVVGVRNSHDKSFSAGLSVGNGVFVCDNLSFSGEITVHRKHSKHVMRDLPLLVTRAIGAIGDLRVSMEERIAGYKGNQMAPWEFNDLLIRAVEHKVIPVTAAMACLREFKAPRHEEFLEGGHTEWTAFNSFTQVLKDRPNVSQLAGRTQRLQGLMAPDSLLGAGMEDVVVTGA